MELWVDGARWRWRGEFGEEGCAVWEELVGLEVLPEGRGEVGRGAGYEEEVWWRGGERELGVEGGCWAGVAAGVGWSRGGWVMRTAMSVGRCIAQWGLVQLS